MKRVYLHPISLFLATALIGGAGENLYRIFSKVKPNSEVRGIFPTLISFIDWKFMLLGLPILLGVVAKDYWNFIRNNGTKPTFGHLLTSLIPAYFIFLLFYPFIAWLRSQELSVYVFGILFTYGFLWESVVGVTLGLRSSEKK